MIGYIADQLQKHYPMLSRENALKLAVIAVEAEIEWANKEDHER